MGMQIKGKNQILTAMLDGASVKLGNISGGVFTPIAEGTTNPNYAPMPVVIYSGSVSASSRDDKKLYLTVSDGIAKNKDYAAYFKDADDGQTADSLTSLTEGGWSETVSAIGIYKNNKLYYACQFSESPVHVYQGHRIKIDKNQFSLTFNVTSDN